MEKTIENMDRNRLGILIRCLVILLITGVTNSAAVFVSPLAAHFNWTADAIANVSTTMLLCWTPGALIGGTLITPRISAALVASTGGYTASFIYGIVLSCVAVVSMYLIPKVDRKPLDAAEKQAESV